jgi:hypothetical protein
MTSRPVNVFARFSRLLRHFARGAFVQFLGLVIVRSDLEQPRVLDLNNLTHELLGCEHQFVIDEPSGSVLGEAAVRMNHDGLLVLHSLVVTAFTKASGMVEKPSCYGL